MKNILVLVAILILSACAENTGIVKMGEGTYMVSRQSGTGAALLLSAEGVGKLKADDLNEANTYCERKGKQLEIISVNAFTNQRRPRVEVQFRCVVK